MSYVTNAAHASSNTTLLVSMMISICLRRSERLRMLIMSCSIGFAFDDGYGKIKGETFRIAHMGDMTRHDLEELFTAIISIMPDLA